MYQLLSLCHLLYMYTYISCSHHPCQDHHHQTTITVGIITIIRVTIIFDSHPIHRCSQPTRSSKRNHATQQWRCPSRHGHKMTKEDGRNRAGLRLPQARIRHLFHLPLHQLKKLQMQQCMLSLSHSHLHLLVQLPAKQLFHSMRFPRWPRQTP